MNTCEDCKKITSGLCDKHLPNGYILVDVKPAPLSCGKCGSKLVNVYDKDRQTTDLYSWKCPNGCFGDKILSVG